MMALKSVEMGLSHPEHAHQTVSHCPVFNIHSRTIVVRMMTTMMSLSLKVSMT